MKKVIFAGPTISKEQILELLPGAIVLPPAEQGDVHFARFTLGADVIGLIDGVHRQRLPVWHKEILGVLQDGCRFIGAASMGALRAVECEPWGAEPIGEVCRWYKEGKIDSDDEVCVTHASKKDGYRKLSLPLVNARASLIAAKIPEDRQAEIISVAQELFYPDRTWKRIFDICEMPSMEREQILDCELDIKEADALHLCYYIQNLPDKPKPEREIRNSRIGYGAVFLNNDRKAWTGKKIIRQHQMALPQFHVHAINRALALEFCKMAGISEVAPEIEQMDEDISSEDFVKLRNEEATLAKAREWFSNAGGGFQDVPKITEFLRVTGMYKTVKSGVKP